MKQGGITIHTDGGSRGNPGPAACAFVAASGEKIIKEESIFLGESTNNHAEYQGVILALGWIVKSLQKVAGFEICFYLDSELVVKQLNGKYKVKNQNLRNLNNEVIRIIKKNDLKIVFKNISREENVAADLLVNKELDKYTNY